MAVVGMDGDWRFPRRRRNIDATFLTTRVLSFTMERLWLSIEVDPTQDGAEAPFGVIDRVRTEMLHRVGLDELLAPVKS